MNSAAVIPWFTRWLMVWGPLSLVYAGLITMMALTAVFSARPARRKAAAEVLRLLLPGRPAIPAPPNIFPAGQHTHGGPRTGDTSAATLHMSPRTCALWTGAGWS